MSLEPKITIKKQLKLGEGPHWDEETQSLYLTDIYDGSVLKYDPKTGSHTQAKVCMYLGNMLIKIFKNFIGEKI